MIIIKGDIVHGHIVEKRPFQIDLKTLKQT